MHTAQILPSVAARATATTAPPSWRGSLPRDGRTGRGRLLVGHGSAAKGVRGAVGHRALTEKPASACGSLTPIDSPSLENRHSRGGFRAGRRQGGTDQAAPPSEGCSLPVQKVVSAPHRLCRQLLRRAVRALGTSFCRAHILPRHMACCPRARSLQRSAR